MSKVKLLTSKMAAVILGFTPDYVRRLCGMGKIKADKFGHDWLFPESAIKNIKRKRKKKEPENGSGV
jgi:excisionase family DNA binding protein